MWRDPMKPTQILAKLCKDNKLEGPTYTLGKVTVGCKTFVINKEAEENHHSNSFKGKKIIKKIGLFLH